jgi:hypothetical protein
MSKRLVTRVGFLVQLVAFVGAVALGVWWWSSHRPESTQPAPPEPTVAAFLNTVRGSLATEQAQQTQTPRR